MNFLRPVYGYSVEDSSTSRPYDDMELSIPHMAILVTAVGSLSTISAL